MNVAKTKTAKKTEPQWTPGPWKASEKCVLTDVTFGGGMPVTVRRICDCENRIYVGEVGAKANAQLIASAPDLYAALKEIVEYGNTNATFLAAQAAVAKAEGR